MKLQLILIFGLPLSGKSAVSKSISEILEIPYMDIDEHVRFPTFGPPHPHPDTSPDLMKKDIDEMKKSYDILLQKTELFLQRKQSIIITATFSRVLYHQKFFRFLEKFPNIQVKAIWCNPQNITAKEISRRLEIRTSENTDYKGSINSITRYYDVQKRFKIINYPHLNLDTSSPTALKKGVECALAYIRE